MKKLCKIIFMVIIVMLFTPVIMNSFANVKEKNLEYINKSSNTLKSIINFNINGLMPGDTKINSFTLKNNSNTSSEVIMTTNEISQKQNNIYLLDKLKVKIICNDVEIFNDKASNIEKVNKPNIKLGTFTPGEEKIVSIITSLDGSTTGNEYQNKYGEFKMIFDITQKDTSTSSSGGVTSTNKPNKLPQTGEQNSWLILMAAIMAIFIGYKFLQKK